MLKNATIAGLTIILGATVWATSQSPGSSSQELTPQDHIDIRHAYAHYNGTIDEGDAEGWVAMWTADGNFNGFKGTAELMRFARHYLDHQDGALRRHWINNLEIVATPEGATAYNYFMILDTSVTPPVVFSTGKNRDTFVRTPEGWRFSSRTSYDAAGNQLQLTLAD